MLSGSRDIDDEAQAERGQRCFHLLHSRGVTQVEDASDLRQMPAEPSREFGTADALLAHRVIERGLRHPQRRKRD